MGRVICLFVFVYTFLTVGWAEDKLMSLSTAEKMLQNKSFFSTTKFIKHNENSQTFWNLAKEEKIPNISKAAKNIQDWISIYYSKTSDNYSKVSPKNSIQNLETLVLNGKRVLTFLQIAGKWQLSGTIDVQKDSQNKALSANASHALLLVGFDRNAKFFIFKNCWGSKSGHNGYLWVSYNYVKTYMMGGIYPATKKEIADSSAQLHIAEWNVGKSGNFFRPWAKIKGSVSGNSKDVHTILLRIQYTDGFILTLVKQSIATGQSFYLREKFLRINAVYAITEVRDANHKTSTFIKRRIGAFVKKSK